MGRIKVTRNSHNEMADRKRKAIRLSDEEIDDASETDMVLKQAEELVEMRERMYLEKLANLKDELRQLKEGIHPEYLKHLKNLEEQFKFRQLLNNVNQESEINKVGHEHKHERSAAEKEFEQKKVQLKKKLISDLEEQKRLIEVERDSMTVKGGMANKLAMQRTVLPIMKRLKKNENGTLKGDDLAVIRRLCLEDLMDTNVPKTRNHCRKMEHVLPKVPHVPLYPSPPLPKSELSQPDSESQSETEQNTQAISKPRKKSKAQETLPKIKFLLGEKEIQEDLDLINKMSQPSTSKVGDDCFEKSDEKAVAVKVQARKLYYAEKCYRLGQPVICERKDWGSERNGHICSINPSDIWIRVGKSKFRVPLTELQDKDLIIRDRCA